MEEFAGFVAAALALTGSPGPNNLSLAAIGAAFGARRGVSYLAGIVAGMAVVMAIVATGVLGILLAVPGFAAVATLASVIYFAYLALRIATAPPLSDCAGDGQCPSFGAGLFLSLVNPKAYAAMAALFSGFVLVRGGFALDAAAKTAVLVLVITAACVTWLVAGATLTETLRDRRSSRIVNIGFAVILIISVAVAALV